MKFFKEYKQFIIAAILFSILGTGVTFALPYVPTDQELDPTCAPGDTDCYVSILAVGNAVTDATAGSIFFAGTSGVLQQDNTNLFWDDTNNRLGIGTNNPSYLLQVEGTTANTKMGIKNANTTSTSNISELGFELKTTVQNRGAAQIQASFPVNTDASRTSLLDFITVDNGTVASALAIRGKNVGIGTTSPTAKLEVTATDFNNGIKVTNSAGNGAGITFDASGTDWSIFGTNAGSAAGANKLAFWSAATSYAMIIDNTGHVGIGTTTATPAARLHVRGSGSTSSTYTAQFHNSTGTNNALVIRDDGRVGILNTDPQEVLHVTGNVRLGGGTASAYIDWGQDSVNSTASYARIQGIRTSSAGNQAGDLVFYTKEAITGGTVPNERWRIFETGKSRFQSTHTAIANNDYAWNWTGTQTSRSTASDTMYGALFNPTMNAGSTNQTLYAMYINPTFGATNSPSIYQLGIEGAGGAIMRLNRTTASASSGVSLGQINYYNGSTRAAILDGVSDGAVDSGRLDFWTKPTGGSLAQSMIIFSNGNVGINRITAPSARLHVVGSGSTSSTNTAVFHNSTGTSNSLIIKDDGAVGIGTSSPNSYAGYGSLTLDYSGGGANNGGILDLEKAGVRYGSLNVNDGNFNLVQPAVADMIMFTSFVERARILSNGTFRLAENASTGTGFTNASGTIDHLLILNRFIPTGGTAVFNGLNMSPTINQTGGANGITRGLYIAPTLTAAADFRAIETSAGKVIFNSDLASSYTASILHDGNNDNRWGLLIQAGADTPTSNKWIQFNDGDGTDQGSVCYTGGQANICAPSDIRLKQNITDTTLSLSILNSIQVKDFSYISDPNNTTIHGFIAQELNEVYPNAVSIPQDPNEHWKVSYNQLTPLIVKSIQDIDTKISPLYTISEDTSLVEKLTTFVRDILVSIENGVAYLSKIKSDRVESKEFCTSSGTCLNESDIERLLEISRNSDVNPNPSPASDPIPDVPEDEPVVDEIPEESDPVEPVLPDEIVEDTTDPAPEPSPEE